MRSIQELYDEVNKLQAVAGEPRTALAECLALLKKTMLSQLASVQEVAGRSRMNKEELVTALSQALLEPEGIFHTLDVMKRPERELLERLLKQPVLADGEIYPAQYMYLQEAGIVYPYWHEDRLMLVLPEEIRQAYNRLDFTGYWEKWERRSLIVDYLAAAANLYGACERSKLLEIFNSQNAEAATADEMTLAGLKHLCRPQYYLIYRDCWISNYFGDDNEDELSELLERSRNKPYYIPDRTEFLRYTDGSYAPDTLQMQRLKAYLSKHIVRDRDLMETLAENIGLACSMEAPLAELFAEFDELDIELSEAQMNAVLPLLVEVHNNTRVWSNRGHTPAEMGAQRAPAPAPLASRPMGRMIMPDFARNAAAPKVGRNDPCPCGSGKKHKKCCGAVNQE